MKTMLLLLILAVTVQATVYEVEVKTENQHDAGTNGAIDFRLVGKKGVSKSHRLDKKVILVSIIGIEIDVYNDFEKNLVTTYEVDDATNIGALKCVQFSTPDNEDWLPSYAKVTPKGGSRSYYFHNTEGTWVSADPSNKHGGVSSLEMCEQGTETYYITTRTSTEWLAGSNHIDLRMTIMGQKGSTKTGYLDTELNDFESGASNAFTVPGMKFIGKVKCIELEAEGDDAWLFDYIEVNCGKYRSAYSFHNDDNVWMSSDETEGSKTLKLC